MAQFNSKDVSQYLEAYKAEMLMRDILEAKQLSGYTWVVVVLSLQEKILQKQGESCNWEEIKRVLLEQYDFDDFMKVT